MNQLCATVKIYAVSDAGLIVKINNDYVHLEMLLIRQNQ